MGKNKKPGGWVGKEVKEGDAYPCEVNVERRHNHPPPIIRRQPHKPMILDNQPLHRLHAPRTSQPIELNHLLHKGTLPEHRAHKINTKDA
jgi:hypothetical protein